MFGRNKNAYGYGYGYHYGYGKGYGSNYYGYGSNSKVHEAIKTLRANIMFSQMDKPIRSIAVTSSVPGEGKSTISHFLAIEMAKAGNKTLIVECDLRRPTQNRMFKIKPKKGLTKYLAGECTLEEAASPTTTENLYFLDVDARVVNPVELLGSERFAKAMDEMKEKFDIVIYDTLPMSQFIEGALIAAHTDGTVIVVRSKRVDQKIVSDTIAQLEKANASIVGVALNDVHGASRGYYYPYRGYGKYGYKKYSRYTGRYGYNYNYDYGYEAGENKSGNESSK